MLRTKDCGDLREEDIGGQPTLAGWVSRRRDHGGVIFVDLRDRSGVVQVVFNPETSPQAYHIADQLRPEWVVQVKGTVRIRPPGSENPARSPRKPLSASSGCCRHRSLVWSSSLVASPIIR